MKALVVDDSDAVRDILASHLARLGFDVDAAADGLQAVSLAAQSAPEVVLLDWAMPGMDGLEVLRRLRAYPPTALTPVIMLLTPHEMPFVESALDAGASEYLMKPFDADALLEKLLLLGVDPEARRIA